MSIETSNLYIKKRRSQVIPKQMVHVQISEKHAIRFTPFALQLWDEDLSSQKRDLLMFPDDFLKRLIYSDSFIPTLALLLFFYNFRLSTRLNEGCRVYLITLDQHRCSIYYAWSIKSLYIISNIYLYILQAWGYIVCVCSQ